GSNRGGLMKNVEAPEHRELACALPFEIFSVGFDGTYFPCYHMIAGVPEHAHLAIDKLDANSSITEAFNHPRIRQWRREIFTQGPKHEPCTSCHLDFIKLTPEQNDGREALLRSLDGAPPAQAQGAEEVRP
ncbi:MAG: SPASM domain-containing protein, partial [Humidesulfovibrio sp.]|nr:SPASM domain-containing protein [Humidesulfovibrio sp.]